MDPAGLARGQAPGPQRGRVPALAPGTPGSVPAKPARLPLIAGRAHPDRIRTSNQPDPARGNDQNPATRLREPRGTSVGETGEAQGSAAGVGKSGSSVDDLAPDSVRAVPGLRVVWCGRTRQPPGFSVTLPSGSGRTARVSAGCSALLSCISGRGCRCHEPAWPARRRDRHGALRPGDRGGDRGGRRGGLRDGIGQTCAGRRLPATSWSLPRGRAGRSCSRAGP